MTQLTAPGVRYGPEGWPEHTLAFTKKGTGAIDWAEQWLEQPDGPEAGQPWSFTMEQARWFAWWYAIDKRGRWVYRRGMLRRMKGWGKDPLASVITGVEFVGPCRFGGWDDDGYPIVVPHPAAWVQIAAVSKDQTRNTMTLFPGLFSKAAIKEYAIDMGKEIIYAQHGRKRIEAVTSSPRALEGGRPTFAVKNESHHWLANNEGIAMADVMERNAAKSRDGSSRILAISNAHAPGEGSDAERDWEAFRVNPTGFLYDSVEAPADFDWDDDDAMIAALEFCRGDSTWLDLERLLAEIRDPKTSKNMARRYYLNQLAASDDRAFDLGQWQTLAAPKVVEPGTLITLGFDGSISRDHTVLIGTEVATGYQWVVGYWEPRLMDDGFRVPVGEVSAAVEAAFERWNVWRMYADPYYWQEQLAAWSGAFNKQGEQRVVAWSTTLYKKMSIALLSYRNAMMASELTHDGDQRFSDAIGNAYRQMQAYVDDNGERMWTLAKERPDSPLKIDAAMAGCLSWQARLDAVASGALNVQDEWHGIYVPAKEPQ